MPDQPPILTPDAQAIHWAVRAIMSSRAAYLAGNRSRLTLWTDASRTYRTLTGRAHPLGR